MNALPFGTGLMASLSLIIAIGSQNAFIIKNCLSNNHAKLICLICFLGDVTLLLLGTFGMGYVNNTFNSVDFYLKIIGGLFVLTYGLISLKKSTDISNYNSDANLDKNSIDVKKIILLSLAFSLLNPHAYLDAFLVLGNIGSKYIAKDQVIFLSGAILGSALWFSSLAIFVPTLGSKINSPNTWRKIDLLVAIMMLVIGLMLLLD